MPPDLQQILQLVPLLFAGGKPGSHGSAAMIRGYLKGQELLRARQLQQGQLTRQGRLDDQQQQLHAATMRNLDADNARQDQALALTRVSASRDEGQQVLDALEKAPETTLPAGADPLHAQNALVRGQFEAQRAYGVPAGTPQTPLPNMTALVSEGKKRRAKARYDGIVKRAFGGDEGLAQQAHIRDRDGEFAGLSPAEIRALYESPLVDAQGRDATALAAPTEGSSDLDRSFQRSKRAQEEQLGRPLSAAEEDQLDTTIRREVRTVNAPAGPRTRYSIQPVTQPDGTTGLVRIDIETGETTPVVLPEGAGSGRASDTQRLSKAYLDRTIASHATAQAFESALAGLGPQMDVQLPNLLKSEAGQRYRQAKDEFINAALRRESGAAIQPSEYARFDAIYFVQPGDTRATIAQKQVARARVVAGFRTAAGNLGRSTGVAGPADEALRILEQRRSGR